MAVQSLHRPRSRQAITTLRGKAQWWQVCFDAYAHPGEDRRHLDASRYLYQLLTGADLTSPAAGPVRLATRRDRNVYITFTTTLTTPPADDGVLSDCWLLVQWSPGQPEPSDYWLSDLPADTSLTDLVQLAKSRWRIEHDYRELKTGLGLDHFEGRSFIGWHRHVTLATAAQLFLTQLWLSDPKAAGQP